jgi:hypothetical protein
MKKNINLKKYEARVLIEEIEKDAYKRGYEKGFEVGAKSQPTKTLGGRHTYRARDGAKPRKVL